ncbi:hypothetical protein EG329_002507 [Mollisiaceae sp. DMI_Dod_QoI]|nr:hypothetical protein EG329_002507 [Helotiales sp. DMI_Dod_QoI]
MADKPSLPPTAIPPGSWILVTGITGYIASHVALEFLNRGYRIRGTTRDTSKAQWLTTSLFKSESENGFFEVASVPDMSVPGSFDKAIKNISAVVHAATNNSLDGNPNNVITPTVEGTKNLLKAAAKESSVKRFVYTGTIGAADTLTSPNPVFINRDSWNEEAVKLAWQEPYGPEKAYAVYAASKTVTEQALWEFVEKEKPGFVTNVVAPYMNMGKILDEHQDNGARTMLKGFVGGKPEILGILPTMAYISTHDDAVIHVGAVLDPDVKNERIFAWAQKFNWNQILAIMRKIYPDQDIVEDLPDPKMFMGEADLSLALNMLRKWGPQDGWTSLEQGVKEILEGVNF